MSAATQFPVVAGGMSYVCAPDDPLPAGLRTNAIVQARLVDELTARPVTDPATIQTAGAAFARARARSAINPRGADGGVVGLVGVPTQVLPALATTAYEVGITVRVPGYVATRQTQMLGPNAAFPGQFAPASLGDIALHRTPVALYGRANVRTPTTFDPLPNVTVRISGIWRVAPTLTASPPAAPANLVAVDPVMYAPRPAGASVRIVTLAPDIPNQKRLLQPAVAGATQVHLSDRKMLVANDVLGIDETDPSRAEWIVVQSIAGAVSDAEPAVATLAYPLTRSHAAGAAAHPTAVSAPIATQALSLPAIAGDTTLLLAAMGGVAPSAAEIIGGAPKPEYHRLAIYETVSDADGQWRLPPLSRVVQLTLDATHMTFTAPPRIATVEYPRREQRLDLVLT